MAAFNSNEEFFRALRSLIEKWCDRRCLKAIHRVLGAYLAFNGLTDAWGDLYIALQDVRAFAASELKSDELKELDVLIRSAGDVLHSAR